MKEEKTKTLVFNIAALHSDSVNRRSSLSRKGIEGGLAN